MKVQRADVSMSQKHVGYLSQQSVHVQHNWEVHGQAAESTTCYTMDMHGNNGKS